MIARTGLALIATRCDSDAMGMESGSSDQYDAGRPLISYLPDRHSAHHPESEDGYPSTDLISPDYSTYDSGFENERQDTTDSSMPCSIPKQNEEITCPGTSDAPHEGADTPSETPDPSVIFANTLMESLAWKVAEAVSATLFPAGPTFVRSLYIGKQIVTMIRGTTSGEGYNLKVSIPGLEVPIEPFGAKLEYLARLHVGGPSRKGPTAGTMLEVQFYEPPTGQGDVAKHHQAPDTSQRPVSPITETAGDSSQPDPWGAWFDLVGEQLVRNLGWALTYVASLPAGTVMAEIKIGVRPTEPPVMWGGIDSAPSGRVVP